MVLKRKILLLFVLATFSVSVFGQKPPPTKEQTKAQKEAKEKEILKKHFEQQEKAEGNQSKLSETVAASVNAKADAFYSAAISQINTKHRIWIKQNAKKIYVEKMDDLSFKVMARYYGQNVGLNEKDIEGLQVLLLRETYLITSKELINYQNKSTDINEKKLSLLNAQQLLSDSSQQLNQEQLDSIDLLISNSVVPEKHNNNSQPLPKVEKPESPDMSARKRTDNTTSFSNLALTRTKLTENIASLDHQKEEQYLTMQEIFQRQQKITFMLSKMVNQVTEHQESIIQHLK